ncbi:fibroblast growth factor receptor 1-like isoform X2 [Pomacea canaliculata]|uniref:fibroblast growth factor receptor 1-like isoform X2 n=1 Tax=Pomacea canaliculata TaxID=400727 RepID=UPI000D7335E8|nr:fibroblast growth factor receptor 1-like isoform X2 [Pomacea canaliculata]
MRSASPSMILLILCLLVIPAVPIADRQECQRKKSGKKCERKEKKENAAPLLARSAHGPKWTSGPPKDTLLIQREGSKAIFKCRANGNPRPSVKWMKDGQTVRAEKNQQYRKSKWKLQINSVTKVDSGNYTCIITNPSGQLKWTYTLRVLENQPISEINIIERPKNQTAHVGDTVVFMCRSDTWPAPTVHWTRKSKSKLVVEIIPMENNSLAEVLVLHNVTKADAGDYTCYIGNELTSLQLSATLTVIEEGESLPFEPRCSLHIRRQILVDNTFGCQTKEPVEITYCMGSCGRSYFIPTMVTTDDTDMQANHLNQTCKCCVGLVEGIRIVQLKCPFGEQKRGFFTLLRDCECQSCRLEGEFSRKTEDNVSLPP